MSAGITADQAVQIASGTCELLDSAEGMVLSVGHPVTLRKEPGGIRVLSGEATFRVAKRDSQRLGPIRLMMIPTGAWQQWDRQRLARNGGSLDQYKHPCLIADPKFRESITIEEEVVV